MSKYTEAARGQPCQIRIPGACNRDDSTVVACHLNGGGAGMKHVDILIAFGCFDCHAAVDRRAYRRMDYEYVRLCHLEGIIRTQILLINMGVLVL